MPISKKHFSAARFRLLSAVLGLLVVPSLLLADQIGLSVSAGASSATGALTGPSQVFGVSLAQSAINVPSLSSNVNYNVDPRTSSASSSFSGAVEFGSISGGVSASAVESDPEQPAGATILGTAASANFSGYWQDSIFVNSSTLAAGTPVNLLFTLVLDGDLGCTGPEGSASASGTFSADSSSINISSAACNSVLNATQTLLFLTAVGADIQVEGQLILNASAVGLNDESSSASVDPPSSEFFIDSETAGAGYTTASGVSYMSPAGTTPVVTPEPSSLELLGVGLLGLMGLNLKKFL
jgi:hypothetical protein